MTEQTSEKKKRGRCRTILTLAGGLIAAVFLISAAYIADYYPADETAEAALVSDETVRVSQTSYGWFFDGPSEDTAMIFYPGAKVEDTAYAPLLHALAAQGVDVCLAKMPFRMAYFGRHRGVEIAASLDYENLYLSGHSLGGCMAAMCAEDLADRVRGVILLAAYAADPLPEGMDEIVLIGDRDEIVHRDRLERGRDFVSGEYKEITIAGGNHAQFGSYGRQRGDGEATITSGEQIARTVSVVSDFCDR